MSERFGREQTILPEDPGLRVDSERLRRNMKWLSQRTPDEFKAMDGKHIVVWLNDVGDHKFRLFSTPKEATTFLKEMPEQDRIGVLVRKIDNRPRISSPRPWQPADKI